MPQNDDRATSILKEKNIEVEFTKSFQPPLETSKLMFLFALLLFAFFNSSVWGSKASKVAQSQLASRTSITNKVVKTRWLQNSKILNNKEQQRAVNTAQFIKILMINEENHR